MDRPEDNSSIYMIDIVHTSLSMATINTTFDDVTTMASTSAPPAVTCLFMRFVMHSVFAGVICIVGILGNTLSMVVLGKDSQSPVATFMLQWLAGADNLFLILWGIHLSLTALVKYSEVDTHISWLFVRVYTYPVLFIAQTATIWMTVVIAASRYVSVCIPYRAAQIVTMPNTRKAVFGTWIFSIVYNLPRFFEAYLTPRTVNGTTHWQYQRTALGMSQYYELIYFDILYYITSFVLPLVLLAVLNSRLTIAYRRIKKRRAQMRSQRTTTSASENDNNITLVMIIVVLTFMLTQAPARMVQILWDYKYTRCDTVQFILVEISKILEVLNSSINIFIYYGLRAKFREALCALLCPLRGLCTTKSPTSLPQTENTQVTTFLTTPDQETTVSDLTQGDTKKILNNGAV